MIMDLKRRSFFSQCLRSAADLVRPVLVSVENHSPARPVPDIRSDLPAELMAEEARRLGLCPETDREEVCKILAARMGPPPVAGETK